VSDADLYFVAQWKRVRGEPWEDMPRARQFRSYDEALEWLQALVEPFDKLYMPLPQYRIIERLDDPVATFMDWQQVVGKPADTVTSKEAHTP
jgi:hypothetical protein